MAVSDDFTKLKEQVEEADRSIKEAVAKEDAELKAMVDEARKNADDRAAQLRAKTQEAAGEADRQWKEVQSNWDQHVKRLRERIDARKAEVDAGVAERDAQWAEADAYDAVAFAETAIEEAEYAVLDAVMARRDADITAAAKYRGAHAPAEGRGPSRRSRRDFGGSRVLDLAHAKREHDVHDAANHGERRDPGDEKNGAATVVAGGPEAERELDDPCDQRHPPRVDLVPNGDRLDDVERPREDQDGERLAGPGGTGDPSGNDPRSSRP